MVHAVDYSYWAYKSKKREVQANLLELLKSTIQYQQDGADVLKKGINVITLGGPYLSELVSQYDWMIGKKGKVYSAEIKDDVWEQQQECISEQYLKSGKLIMFHGDWFSLAEAIVRQNCVPYLEMDFCSTIDSEWDGSLSKLHPVIEEINPKVKTVYISMTHSGARFKDFDNREHFFLERFPHYWESMGWRCHTKQLSYYREYNGGCHMYSSFYHMNRR